MLRPREELKVYARVFDNYTFENLIYLADHGIFRSLAFPISSGKEAEAYTAWRDKELITLKIYKIETLNYHKLKDLLLADYRFSKNLKLSRRAIVEAWARKEFTNLSIAYEAKVRVPRPIAVCKNVIAMQFIGSLSGPAPLLLKAEIKNPDKFIKDLYTQFEKLFFSAKLVHGDLSEYNILVSRQKPYFIDMSQATPRDNPVARELFLRDLRNLARIQKKLGVSYDTSEILKKFETWVSEGGKLE